MNSVHGNGRKRRMMMNNNCQDCYEEDTMDMVQCDRCDEWSHFDCAGVGPEIAKVLWLCHHCKRDTNSGVDCSVNLIQPSTGVLHQSAYKSSKNVDNGENMIKQTPITVSEKMKNLEIKFEAVIEDVAELKIELQSSKDQLLEAKNEIAKVKKENAELHSQLLVSAEEIEKNRAEIFDLKKQNQLGNVNVASAVRAVKITDVEQVAVGSAVRAVKITDVEQVAIGSAVKSTALPRIIYQKLPCKTETELEVLKANLMSDLATFTYMEERFGLIGGSDLKACISHILNRLFSKELQGLMSLTGKRTDKPVILMKYTIVMDLINNAVRITHVNHKDKDSEPIITKLLGNK